MDWAHDQKEGIMYRYFQNRLGKKMQRQETINRDMLDLPRLPAQCLDAPFSEYEVSKAIAELPSEKATGPDGFIAYFTGLVGASSKLKLSLHSNVCIT
jgi:hypothetical protein